MTWAAPKEEQPLCQIEKIIFRSCPGGILKTVEGGLFPLYGVFDFLFAHSEGLVVSEKGAGSPCWIL